MKYSLAIQKAIRFSVKTHEVYQKQKRKGKDIPYIIHPLIAGLILSQAGASEDTIIAGILHDTIEDSHPEKPVTVEMIAERFGEHVADLVQSVTETDKKLSWAERKQEALDHIEHFSPESVLVKSADVLSNGTELLADHKRYGAVVFDRFKATREDTLANYQKVIAALLRRFPESPLAEDLRGLSSELQKLDGAGQDGTPC